MVKLFRLLLSCVSFVTLLSVANQAAVAAETQRASDTMATISPQKIRLGEPILLRIKGKNIANTYQNINWQLLKKHFVRESMRVTENSLRARFYPIKAGTFNLPEQNLGAYVIPATQIKVQKNPEIVINWRSPKAQSFVGQPMQWSAQVRSVNPAYRVEMQAFAKQKITDLKVTIREQFSVTTSAINASEGFKGREFAFFAHYQWPNTELSSKTPLYSPFIKVTHSGNRPWRFVAPPVLVTRQALPSFLPPGVAVGKINWQAQPLDVLQATKSLHYWHWQLQAWNQPASVLKNEAYRLLQTLQQAPQLQKKVRWLGEKMTLQEQIGEKGVLRSLQVAIPYQVLSSGKVHWPAMALRVFVPATQKLSTTPLKGTVFWALPSEVFWLLQSVLVVLLVAVLAAIGLMLRCRWHTHKTFKTLQQAQTASEIWYQLVRWQGHYRADLPKIEKHQNQFSDANQAPISIGQWLAWGQAHLSSNTKQQATAKELANALNMALYGEPLPGRANSQFKEQAQKQTFNADTLQHSLQAWIKAQPLCSWRKLVLTAKLSLAALLKRVKK